MSKAFTSEEAPDEPAIVVPRAPLPEGVTNFVTPRGLELLRAEQRELVAARAGIEALADAGERAQKLAAWTARLAALEARLGSAVVVDPSQQARHEGVTHAGTPMSVVRFGATVVVSGDDGRERSYRIVGVDEADASRGDIAFVSPLARALLGSQLGDSVLVRTPRGEEELSVLAITYAAD